MMYSKKLLLCSAIGLALGSGQAFGLVNIDTSAPGTCPVTYAGEPVNTAVTGLVNGQIDDAGSANLNLTGQIGWSAGPGGGNSRFIRFDFIGAELTEPLLAGIGDGTGGGTTGSLVILAGDGNTVGISEGGQIGDDYVIFEVTNTGTIPVNNTDSFRLRIRGVLDDNKSGATVRYRAYPNELDAQRANEETLKDVTAGWFCWSQRSIAVSCDYTPGQDGLIDTINRAFWEDAPFVSPAERQIARASAGANQDFLNPATAQPVTFDEFFPQGNALFHFERAGTDGGFQGISSIRLLDDGSVLGSGADVSFAPNQPQPNPGVNPSGFSGTYVAFNPNGYVDASVLITNGADRDGTPGPDEMLPTEFQVRFSQAPTGGQASFIVPEESALCGETLASGSSDRLDFTAAVLGTGLNRTLFRIVNPSDRAGDVCLKLINDDGDETSCFGIGNLAGIDSDVLGAGASTALIDIDVAYNWAVANEGFMIAAPASTGAVRNKLRMVVRGSFGEDAYDGNWKFNNPTPLVLSSNGTWNIFGGTSSTGTITGSLPGPSASGALRVRGNESKARNVNTIQIQGFMVDNQNRVTPFNER